MIKIAQVVVKISESILAYGESVDAGVFVASFLSTMAHLSRLEQENIDRQALIRKVSEALKDIRIEKTKESGDSDGSSVSEVREDTEHGG